MVLLAIFVASPAHATVITYTSSTSFFASLGGFGVTEEDYEALPMGTPIPSGAVVNDLLYTFSVGSGVVGNVYSDLGTRSLYGEKDGVPGVSPSDIFFPGDSFTVSFPGPVYAVGGFFNIRNSTSVSDYVFVSTEVGTAFSGGPTWEPTSGFFFVGLMSDVPFGTATFGATPGAPSGYNFDNLTYAPVPAPAPVPEPGNLALLVTGLAALLLRRRHKVV